MSILLFIGLVGFLFSMLEWSPFRMLEVFSGAFVPSGIADGFRLVINRLFAISEAEQAYIYVMLAINSPESEWGANIAAALVILTLLLAVASFVLVKIRNKIPLIIVLTAVVAAQVYFGVFPAPLWNIVLFAAFALVFADKRGKKTIVDLRGKAVVAGMLAVIAAIVWGAFPDSNPQLYEFSESVRDRFGTRINIAAVSPPDMHGTAGIYHDTQDRALNVVDVQEETLHETPLDEYQIEHDDQARGAEIGAASPLPSMLPLLLAIIVFAVLIAVISAVIRHISPLYKMAKRRRMFGTGECSAAINDMFAYMLEWLEVYGLQRKNVVFSEYTNQLAKLVSAQYSQEYETITALWNRAVYSNQPIGETERRRMKEFLDKTMGIVWENSRLADRIRIKLHHHL